MYIYGIYDIHTVRITCTSTLANWKLRRAKQCVRSTNTFLHYCTNTIKLILS